MTRVGAASLASVIAVVLLAALSACSDGSQAENPYASEIEAVRAQATSEFERSVFDDLTISRAEYDEATQRYVTCLNDSGYTVSKSEIEGIYSYAVDGLAEGPAWDAIDLSCRLGNNALIEPLFVDMTVNPGRDDFQELIAKCLVSAGLVEPTFTAEELSKYLGAVEGDSYTAPLDPPWSESDERVQQCFSRPAG